MISFVGAIRLGFQRYSDFNARSILAEYWWWLLFVVLTGIASTLIDMSIGTFCWEAQEGLLSVLFKLATLIPGLALGARRLHDINKSAWWLLMWLIVWLVIPMILLLVWAARRGDNGPNNYGLDLRDQP
jgi:uncharacterized membrane protein YhaH (DUF805 family)